jgi:hypothetical protein
MNERLKEATKLRQEALLERKVALSAHPAHAIDFHIAAICHDAAADKLMDSVPQCDIVAGEVVPTEAERPDGKMGYAIRNTLASPDTAAIAASIERTELLTQGYTDVLALGIDAAQSIGGHNSLEKMLAHQMALAHKTAFQLTDRAMQERDTVEMARLINAAARMMSVYQQAMLTLNRLRTGGNQTVTVQHVNINGGQAVVTGTMQAGGRAATRTGGSK